MLLMCATLALTAVAQDIQIPLQPAGGMHYVTLGVNGTDGLFIFDTGANGITLNKAFFDNLKRKGLASDADITGSTTATLANGTSINASLITIKELKIGQSVLNNVTGILIPNNSAPMLVGRNIFEKLGTVSADFGSNMLIIKPGRVSASSSAGSAGGAGAGGMSPINPTQGGGGGGIAASAALQEIYTVKLIPCSASDMSQVKRLEQLMRQDPNFSHIKVEIESKIPPANAVSRITQGSVTIRYFDTTVGGLIQQSEFLTPVDQLISASPRNYPSAAQGENMLPYFNNRSIPNYVEIWVRQQ